MAVPKNAKKPQDHKPKTDTAHTVEVTIDDVVYTVDTRKITNPTWRMARLLDVLRDAAEDEADVPASTLFDMLSAMGIPDDVLEGLPGVDTAGELVSSIMEQMGAALGESSGSDD